MSKKVAVKKAKSQKRAKRKTPDLDEVIKKTLLLLEKMVPLVSV
ncbi:MAG: hypothetical protein ACO3BW_08420 [Ilumatobacteraceae bacterium]